MTVSCARNPQQHKQEYLASGDRLFAQRKNGTLQQALKLNRSFQASDKAEAMLATIKR